MGDSWEGIGEGTRQVVVMPLLQWGTPAFVVGFATCRGRSENK